ncbi:MAG: HemY protein [Oleispira sp.]|jgi:HemY protein
MKKLVILMAGFLLVGLFFGYLISLDSGYVLFSWANYTLETSFWFFSIMLVAFFISAYLVLRFVLLLIGSDWRINDWRKQRLAVRGQRQATRGFLSLAHGQWQTAERQLTQAAALGDNPLINYLCAARAAYEKGDMDKSDHWLKEAANSTKGAELAVAITQIQLLISRGQAEQALAVVLRLRKHNPKHKHLLKMHLKVLRELEDWVGLKDLLPTVRKFAKFIPQDKLKELEEKVVIQLMQRTARSHVSSAPAGHANLIKAIYEDAPRSVRLSVDVLKCYIDLLLLLKQPGKAEQALRSALPSVWHDTLIDLYGRIQGDDLPRQLLFAEQQLQERPNDPMLLLALGRMANRTGNKEKAQEYLEAAAKIKALPEVHTELGNLLTQQGKFESACEHFNKALA